MFPGVEEEKKNLQRFALVLFWFSVNEK